MPAAISRWGAPVLGAVLLVAAVGYLRDVASLTTLVDSARALAASPGPVLVALAAYAAAFLVRTAVWVRVQPALPPGQAWAGLHVSVLGNHVLPMRLGEVLRVTSVLRRTGLPARPVVTSAVTVRMADLLAVVVLALVAGPHVALTVGGSWVWVALGVGLAALAAMLVLVRRQPDLRLPGPGVAVASLLAWALESGVVLAVAHVLGVTLSVADAITVTAVTIAAQVVALTPGGIGSYEAAATAALATLGVDPAFGFSIALLTHGLKTVYALLTGFVALAWPSPSYAGRFRLPQLLPPRPAPLPVAADAPVVAIVPVHDELETVGAVVCGLPRASHGHAVLVLVIDDGSTDGSAEAAAAAGATVLAQPRNLGLGAAVRRGLAEASALSPAAVVYLDADLEYDPAELCLVVGPVLSGKADYVVGSRFAGTIGTMRPHRRLGNHVLTAWVRWMTRRRDLTDGQSGYRAFSPRAAREAEIVHDYNYAQVLTLDLLAKGFAYAEVPITYSFRSTGDSFVRLGRYLRKVVPAVRRELNAGGSVLDPVPGEAVQRGGPGHLVEGAVHT